MFTTLSFFLWLLLGERAMEESSAASFAGFIWTFTTPVAAVTALVAACLCPFRSGLRQALRLSRVAIMTGAAALGASLLGRSLSELEKLTGDRLFSLKDLVESLLLCAIAVIPLSLGLLSQDICQRKLRTMLPPPLPNSSHGQLQPHAKPWRHIARDALQSLSALITTVLGGFLGIFGFGLVSSAGFNPARPTHSSIEIATVTLEGWKIYACAATALILGISFIALGLSLFPQRKTSDDRVSWRRSGFFTE